MINIGYKYKYIDIMNKEEQHENMYRILLTRNQQNYEIIRKYRKKSNNYHKRILMSNHSCISDVKNIRHVTLEKVHHVLQTQIILQVHALNAQSPKKKEQHIKKVQIAQNVGEYNQKQEEIQRNRVKLPSIMCQLSHEQKQTQGYRDDYIVSKQKQSFIAPISNTQQQHKLAFSQSACREAQHNMLEVGEDGTVVHAVKMHTETNQNETENNTIMSNKQPKIQRISQKIKCDGNMVTQSVRSTATQANTRTVNPPNGHNHKRQARLSNSHKTLLNLHEIVFECKPKGKLQQIAEQRRQDRYSNNQSLGAKIKEISKIKYKQKYREKQKQKQKQKTSEQKQNIGFYHSSQGINCKNNINSIIQHMSVYATKSKRITQNSELNNSVHALLTNQNTYNNMNSMNSNRNANNINIQVNNKYNSISISALSYLNSNILNARNQGVKNQEFSDQNQKINKQSQLFPQIHKFKEVRLNFHKLLKKQHNTVNSINNNKNNVLSNGYCKNVTGATSAHNYSYSLNSIYHNNTQPISQDNQISRRAFKIEAIPVHPIKWV